MIIPLERPITVRYVKHDKLFKCICKNYDLTGTSAKSFELALIDLQNMIETIIINAPKIHVVYKVTEL